MKKYVYVPSYQGIFFAEYLNCKYSSLTVFTTSKQVKDFLETIDIGVVHLSWPTCSLKNPKNFLKIKKIINLEISNIRKKSELYFCHNAFDIAGFYFVKVWGHLVGGKIHYCDMDPKRENFEVKILANRYLKNYASCLVRKLLIRMLWGLSRIEILATPDPVLGIGNSFQEYYSINRYNECCPDEIRRFIPQTKIVNISGSIIYLADLNYKFDIKILKTLSKYKLNTIVKPHPASDKIISLDGYRVVEKYIPAECFFEGKCVVVGVASAAMKEALRKNILTISLLKIYYDTGLDEERAKFLFDFICDDCYGQRLKVPKSTDEFLAILEQYFQRADSSTNRNTL